MVSLAHCHGKRGSSRAERAHVKSARRSARGRGHVEVCVNGLKLVSCWLKVGGVQKSRFECNYSVT